MYRHLYNDIGKSLQGSFNAGQCAEKCVDKRIYTENHQKEVKT